MPSYSPRTGDPQCSRTPSPLPQQRPIPPRWPPSSPTPCPAPCPGAGQPPGGPPPLAPDVAFHTATLTPTLHGQDNVRAYQNLVDDIQGPRSYLARIASPGRLVEYWNCVIDGHLQQGIDLFQLADSGQVTDPPPSPTPTPTITPPPPPPLPPPPPSIPPHTH